MKRAFKISDAAQSELLYLHKCASKPQPHFALHSGPINHRLAREICSQSQPGVFPSIITLFMNKLSLQNTTHRKELKFKVSQFREELLHNVEDSENIDRVLEKKGDSLLESGWDGIAFLELLNQLGSWPDLAQKVFDWRRKQSEYGLPLTSEEYAKGIAIAGRMKNVDLAVELFSEATYMRLKTTSTYNALMGAYMSNGLGDKCQALFQDLKNEPNCCPSIVTYNILLSVFGRMMLVDNMEAAFREIEVLNLSPNLVTYNNIISGYVTAWMWDNMERTYQRMKEGFVKPDISTHLIMLRGYAHSGNLEKMEEIYSMIKDYVNDNEIALIRAMICAYCQRRSTDRVEKIQGLIRLIPDREYRPWLNVMLIRVYAQEDWLEEMENSINEAFEHRTSVNTMGVMRAIVGSYFRYNAIDKLADFVKRAEYAGWRICRSLYHGQMVLYGRHSRLEEMEDVLNEMVNCNFGRTKKTFYILYKAYTLYGQRNKVDKVRGLMCKHGYGIPLDDASS